MAYFFYFVIFVSYIIHTVVKYRRYFLDPVKKTAWLLYKRIWQMHLVPFFGLITFFGLLMWDTLYSLIIKGHNGDGIGYLVIAFFYFIIVIHGWFLIFFIHQKLFSK